MGKKLALLALVLIAAMFFWASSERWVNNPVWSLADVSPWLAPLIFLVILAATLGISFMLLPDYRLKVVASVISAMPFVLIFGIAPIYFGAALVMVLMHLSAISRIDDEVRSRIQVKAKHIVRRGVSMIILPHLLLISFAYYQTPAVRDAGKDLKLPPAVQTAIAGATQTFLGPELDRLPPTERARIEGQLLNQVVHMLTELAKPYFEYLPPLLAFGLFLALQGLSPIFFELGSLLALAVFLILKASGFVKIEKRNTEAETIKY